LKKNIIFLVSGFLVLIIGVHVVVAGYLATPQDKEWTVNYSLPAGKLETGGKNYTIGGVYTMQYSRLDVIWVRKYDPIFLYRGSYDDPEELYVIFTNVHNWTLETHRLFDMRGGYSFVSYYPSGELRIYLGSPLPYEELLDQGYYGDWDVTFVLRHYPSALDFTGIYHNSFLVYGGIVILAGVVVTTFSLTKVVKNKKETRVSKK
jgi:hypothetical protein